MTIEQAAAAVKEWPLPSPWRAMSWSKPPTGKTVLFFYRGRIIAGMLINHPIEGQHLMRFENMDVLIAGQYTPPQRMEPADLTHWRELPQERP